MKLFFREYGQGSPFIILHGLFGISDNWATFGKSLMDNYHVYIPDMRNHGRSPRSTEFDFSSMMADIQEFIDVHKLHNPVLMGHSMGGKVAMLLALNKPELLNKLIVVDVSPRKYPQNTEHLQLLNAMLSTDLTIAHSRSEVELQIRDKIKSQRLRQFLLKNLYWNDHDQLEWRLNLPVLNASLPLMFGGIESDTVFTRPVLFIRGSLSGYIKEEDIEAIRKNFPDAIIKTLPGAGHWAHADAPEEFFLSVTDFLNTFSH
jgi:pimeloyl-ACP methyl ester carboxylesterase